MILNFGPLVNLNETVAFVVSCGVAVTLSTSAGTQHMVTKYHGTTIEWVGPVGHGSNLEPLDYIMLYQILLNPMVSKPKDHPPVKWLKWALQINTTIFRVRLRTISPSPIELMPLLIDDHPEISSGLTKVVATKVVTARIFQTLAD